MIPIIVASRFKGKGLIRNSLLVSIASRSGYSINWIRKASHETKKLATSAARSGFAVAAMVFSNRAIVPYSSRIRYKCCGDFTADSIVAAISDDSFLVFLSIKPSVTDEMYVTAQSTITLFASLVSSD